MVSAAMIVLSSPQLAPSNSGESQRAMGVPPSTCVFHNLPEARKATQRPSQEKNGPLAPSVPGSSTGSDPPS